MLTPNEQSIYDLLESPVARNELKRLAAQTYFMTNFKAFVGLLGFKDIGEFHVNELLKMEKTPLGVPSRRLWLWARGHFKTSIISEAHTIYLLVNNPDLRVLVVSNTLEIAKTMLRNIKEQFIKNEDFRFFFREFCPKANKEGKIEFGTTESFTVCNRKRVLKEPSVMCAGVGTNLTGLHFDYMKIDDLVTKDSVTNDTQINLSKEYYASLRQLYDNPLTPREDIIGTTYHFNDLYQDLIKNNEFQKSIIPIRDKDGKINFHERFTEEGIVSLENDPSIGPYAFASQYLLNPVNPKDVKFKEEWIKFYDKIPENCSEYICVDPASTQKKKSDYTVIERWGIDHEGCHYLIEAVRDRLTSFERIDALFRIAKNSKNLRWVKYEVLGGRHGDLEVIKEKQIKEGFSFFIKETKSTTSSKRDRIEQRLVGPYYAGKILLPRILPYFSKYTSRTHDFVQELKLELLQFPFTEHDDILDCQSQMFEEELILGQENKAEANKKWGTANDWEKFYKDTESISRGNPLMTLDQKRSKFIVRKIRKSVGRYGR